MAKRIASLSGTNYSRIKRLNHEIMWSRWTSCFDVWQQCDYTVKYAFEESCGNWLLLHQIEVMGNTLSVKATTMSHTAWLQCMLSMWHCSPKIMNMQGVNAVCFGHSLTELLYEFWKARNFWLFTISEYIKRRKVVCCLCCTGKMLLNLVYHYVACSWEIEARRIVLNLYADLRITAVTGE